MPPDGNAGEVQREPFYYVNVEDAEESTHDVQDRAVNIDPSFESSLREQHKDTTFNSFLALPEVIPTRKRKSQQPTLDFTSSKILTSEEYISACEEVLAKRQENEEAAKRKAAERAANKETRQKEKEARIAGVAERKAQREAKRRERERQAATKQAAGGRCRRRQPPTSGDAGSPTTAIQCDPGSHGDPGSHSVRGEDQGITTTPASLVGFFNPLNQLPASTSTFQPPNTTSFQPPNTSAFQPTNNRLWQTPSPMFYNPMLMSSFFPPSTASFNPCDRNGNAH